MKPLDPLLQMFPPTLRALVAGARPVSDGERRLAQILQVEPEVLPTLRLGRALHYRPFRAEKPDGRERRLFAPSPALKRLQRAILSRYLAYFPIHHPFATAYFPGASTVRNARPHAWSRLVATVDLRDFFESTRASRVRRFFARQGWDGEALDTLMRLCVYQGGLPQGAPTSPCLSNLVNVGLDRRLERLATRSVALYTRYGDDLTFSWDQDEMPGGFTNAVEDVLGSAGYEVQPRKGWRVTPASARPVVTGVVLSGDGRLRVPVSVRLKMWACRWKRLFDPSVAARLEGYRGYVRMVERS
ncbi:MAG: reverse transcriptase domain-containing protein [Isosphaeraceae bacterium]